MPISNVLDKAFYTYFFNIYKEMAHIYFKGHNNCLCCKAAQYRLYPMERVKHSRQHTSILVSWLEVIYQPQYTYTPSLIHIPSQ